MGATPAPAQVASPAYLSIEAAAPAETLDPLAQEWIIYLDGQFDRGAATRLGSFLAQENISQASIFLNSPGGSLIGAMAVGRLLREHGFHTHVGKRTTDPHRPASGVCYSACPFAYAGGVGRFLEEGSALGIHRATNRVSVPDESAFEQAVSGQAMDYLTAMGVDSELFPMMEAIPPNGIRLLTRQEAFQLNLATNGEAHSPSQGQDP